MQDNHSQPEWLTSASNDSSRVGSRTSKVCNLWPARSTFKIDQKITCAWMMEVCKHRIYRWEKAYETCTSSEGWKNKQTQDIIEQLYSTALFSALPLVKGTQIHKTHLLLIKWEKMWKEILHCFVAAMLIRCHRSLRCSPIVADLWVRSGVRVWAPNSFDQNGGFCQQQRKSQLKTEISSILRKVATWTLKRMWTIQQ
jgi:hypothetical protein